MAAPIASLTAARISLPSDVEFAAVRRIPPSPSHPADRRNSKRNERFRYSGIQEGNATPFSTPV